MRSESLGALNLLRNVFTLLHLVNSLSSDSDSGNVSEIIFAVSLVDVSAIFIMSRGWAFNRIIIIIPALCL